MGSSFSTLGLLGHQTIQSVLFRPIISTSGAREIASACTNYWLRLSADGGQESVFPGTFTWFYEAQSLAGNTGREAPGEEPSSSSNSFVRDSSSLPESPF